MSKSYDPAIGTTGQSDSNNSHDCYLPFLSRGGVPIGSPIGTLIHSYLFKNLL